MFDDLQQVIAYVQADSPLGKIVDSKGQSLSVEAPALMRGMEMLLCLRLFRGDSAYPYNILAALASWDCVLDNDWDTTTPPKLRADNENISVIENAEYTEVQIPLLENNTSELVAALNNDESTTLGFELCGFAAGKTTPAFVLQINNIPIRNRRSDSGTGSPEPISDGNYTAAQVDVLIRASFDVQFSIDGATDWHETSAPEDRFFRVSKLGGEWSDAIKLAGYHPQGAYAAETTYLTNDTVTYNGSLYASRQDTNTGHSPDEAESAWWLKIVSQGIQGIQGIQGSTGATGATNINILTSFVWNDNLATFAYPLSDVDPYLRFAIVKSMSSLKLGIVSGNPTYTGNAVLFATTGRTALTQAGWTASTAVSGAYYRSVAPGSTPTFVTEDSTVLAQVTSSGSLVAGTWFWGDADTLGADTLYVFPSAGNDPTTAADGFYQYDTSPAQIIAVGATPAEVTISASFATYNNLELWRDANHASDTLNNAGTPVAANILDGAEYSK